MNKKKKKDPLAVELGGRGGRATRDSSSRGPGFYARISKLGKEARKRNKEVIKHE